MSHRAVAVLQGSLRPHVALSKSRLETLCLLVVGMISARTVNLGHVACERSGAAVLIASTYRRLQRFFQHVRLGRDWALPLVVRLLGLQGSWHLALDRTQWSIGMREVNYLVLAVVTRRFRVPLVWSVLPDKGNSSSAVRIALIKRYLAHFPASSIRLLLADREFVGADWLKFLHDNNIGFAIRLRENLRVTDEAGHELTLFARLRLAGRTRTFRARLGARDDAATRDAPLLNFAAKRLKDEWLIVVSNIAPRTALAAYRKRWAIECLFGDAKTRGLNLEDTRLTDPRKLDLLMALIALALAWAGRTAATLLGPRGPKRKGHGYLAKSWFRTGFDQIRNLLRSDPVAAIAVWLRLPSKPLQTRGVV
jgi:Transposase DDE domain